MTTASSRDRPQDSSLQAKFSRRAAISSRADHCSIAATEPACSFSAFRPGESILTSRDLWLDAVGRIAFFGCGFHLRSPSYAPPSVSPAPGPTGTPRRAPQWGEE